MEIHAENFILFFKLRGGFVVVLLVLLRGGFVGKLVFVFHHAVPCYEVTVFHIFFIFYSSLYNTSQ